MSVGETFLVRVRITQQLQFFSNFWFNKNMHSLGWKF